MKNIIMVVLLLAGIVLVPMFVFAGAKAVSSCCKLNNAACCSETAACCK